MKTHWLFGNGPNKSLEFNIEIDKETNCTSCIHNEVCHRMMDTLCNNYLFGASDCRDQHGCSSCSHRYTRFDKDEVPCFTCKKFKENA